MARRSTGLVLLGLAALTATAVPLALARPAAAATTVDGFTVQAIEAAISRAQPGESVVFPGGVYPLDRAFGFRSGIDFVSDPAAPAVLRYAGTTETLTLTDADNPLRDITIRGLSFDNVRLTFSGSRDVTLQDCVFRNGKVDPEEQNNQQWEASYLKLKNTTGFTVDHCTFLRDSSSGGRGVNAYRTTETVIKDSYFGTTGALEAGVPNGYFRTAINVGGWAASGGIGSHSIVIDGNVMRRREGIPRYVSTANPNDDEREDHGVYAWGVRDLTVTRNFVDGWTSTSDGGALKVRNAEEVFVLDNHFQSSGVISYTHFCGEDTTVTCPEQQVRRLNHTRIGRNRVDVPLDVNAGLQPKIWGIYYWRTATTPPKSYGPVCTGTGFEEIQITDNVFPRGGVVYVNCAEGPKVCVAGNTGGEGVVSGPTLSGTLATTGCSVPDAWDQPLAGVHRGDFNGDGRPDFVRRVRVASGFTWRMHISNGDGYLNQDWGDGVWLRTDTERYGVLVADFDGNGFDDIAYHATCGALAQPCWRVQRSTGAGFMAPRNYGDSEAGGVRLSAETFDYGFHAGDFNGDGRADIVFRGQCGADQHPCWAVLASQPDATFSAQDWGDSLYPHPSRTRTYGLLIGDFDGDRRDDIAYPGRCGAPGADCLRVHRATGAASFHAENWGTAFYLDEAPVDTSAHFGMRVVDINDDGRADIGYRGEYRDPAEPRWCYHLGSASGGFTVTCPPDAH